MLFKRTAMGIGFLSNCINYLKAVLKRDFILFERVSSTSSRDEPQTLPAATIELFSASEKTHCALVVCERDSE